MQTRRHVPLCRTAMHDGLALTSGLQYIILHESDEAEILTCIDIATERNHAGRAHFDPAKKRQSPG